VIGQPRGHRVAVQSCGGLTNGLAVCRFPLIIQGMKWRALFEGRWIFAILAIFWVVSLLVVPVFSLLIAGMILFSLYFFRDPERAVPADESLAVSPADGVVVAIEEVEEEEYLHCRVKRIVIFLSVLDVHVNRAPCEGEVIHSVSAKGKFLDARNPESSKANARRTWVFRTMYGDVIVRQITGAIARRIVAWSRVGDRVQRGERFGMIRFGSRTEVDFPLSAQILVKPGDKVAGGATAVARLGEEH